MVSHPPCSVPYFGPFSISLGARGGVWGISPCPGTAAVIPFWSTSFTACLVEEAQVPNWAPVFTPEGTGMQVTSRAAIPDGFIQSSPEVATTLPH